MYNIQVYRLEQSAYIDNQFWYLWLELEMCVEGSLTSTRLMQKNLHLVQPPAAAASLPERFRWAWEMSVLSTAHAGKLGTGEGYHLLANGGNFVRHPEMS